MRFQEIFQYFNLASSSNLTLLPKFARDLIEIHRIECLRKQNRLNSTDKIVALGDHSIWPERKIVMIGDFPYFTAESYPNISLTAIDPVYDHIIAFNMNISQFGLNKSMTASECYLHQYSTTGKENLRTNRHKSRVNGSAI